MADVWTNLAGDGLWKTANNWSLNRPPAAGENAVFDGTKSNASATFDTDVIDKAINQLVFQGGYLGTLNLTAATLSLTDGMKHQSNANIAGTGSIELFGTDSVWQNLGTLSLALVHVNANASMAIAAAMNLNVTSLVNDGTLTWNSSTIKATAGGLVLNRASSVFTMNPQGVNGLLFDSDLNVDTINLSMLPGSTLGVAGGNDEIRANFFMAGTANLSGGSLTASFTSESSGTYNLSGTLTSLTFSPPTTGTSLTQFDAGARILNVGNNPAAATIQQGVCTFAGGTVQIDALYVQPLAVLNGAGTLNVTHMFTLLGAINVANTNLLANSTDQLGPQMPTGDYVNIGGNFTNSGNLTWYGSINIEAGAQVVNNGVWTANFQSPFLTDYSQGGTKGTFTNNGTLTVASNATPTIQIPFTNAGTFNVNGSIGFVLDITQSAGITTVAGAANLSTGARFLINGGTVTGWGSITTTNGVFNSGTISLTSTQAALTINGNLTEEPDGVISVVIDTSAMMNPRLAISGNLARNGTLRVQWKNGTPPNAAKIYTIFTYAAIDTGSFTEDKPPKTSFTYGATTTTLSYAP